MGCCIFIFTLSFLTLFLALCVSTLLDQLLFISVEVLVFVKRVLAEISHVNFNFGLVGTHVVFNLPKEKLKVAHKLRILLPDKALLLHKVLLHVQDQLPKEFLVVQDQLRDDCFVDLCRGELILSVFDDHGCELGKVLRYLGGAVLDNQKVLIP